MFDNESREQVYLCGEGVDSCHAFAKLDTKAEAAAHRLIFIDGRRFSGAPLTVLFSPARSSICAKKMLERESGIQGRGFDCLCAQSANGLDENGFIFDTIFFVFFVVHSSKGQLVRPLLKHLCFTEQKRPRLLHIAELRSSGKRHCSLCISN